MLSIRQERHIIAYPSRTQTHNKYRPQITAHFRSCRIGGHLLKEIELWIEVVLPDTEPHHTISEQAQDVFSSQVLLRREGAFQGRFSIRWASISTTDNKQLVLGFLRTMMNWSRVCWFNSHNKLFGSRKDLCSLQRH